MKTLKKIVVAVSILLVGLMPALAQTNEDPHHEITGTVSGFYNWYLDYTTHDETGSSNNPLVDRAYREASYLSAELVEKMDTLLSEEPIMYDPFLCAQDVPESFEIDVVGIAPEQATVLLRTYFQFNPHSHNITLTLRPEDADWNIDAIICADTITPEGVTRDFYNWYLVTASGGLDEPVVNPLVERLYHDHSFLTDDLKARVDAMGEGDMGFMFDPFVCAQDVPGYVRVYASTLAPEAANVVVEMDYPGNPRGNTVLVSLKPVEQQWMIDTITCSMEPEAVAALVYSQYILHVDYMLRHGSSASIAFEWSTFAWDHYMMDDLRNDLVEQLNGSDLRADPFLCAQDLPAYVEGEVQSLGENSATINITGYWLSGPDMFEAYPLAVLEMIRDEGSWKLSGQTCR